MKKFFSAILLASTVLIGISCRQDIECVDDSLLDTVVFTACTDEQPVTKATLETTETATKKVLWQAGDKIGLFTTRTEDNFCYVANLKAGEGTNVGSFAASNSLQEGYIVNYSAFPYDSSIGKSSGYIVYPSSLSGYKSGDLYTPMLAVPSEPIVIEAATTYGGLYFSHVGGAIKFKLRNVPAGVSSVAFTANENINGKFYIDEANLSASAVKDGSWVKDLPEGESKITTFTFDPLSETQDILFYVPVPAGVELTAKLTIEVNAQYGNVQTFEKTFKDGGSYTVKRAVVANMGEFEVTEPVPGPAEDADEYVKVTAAPADWSGTYLIVYEAGNLAFDGSLSKLDAAMNTVNVSISDNRIIANEELNQSTFTVSAIDGGYSVMSAGGLYIGRSANSNGLDSQAEAVVNTISINTDGSVNVIGAGGAYLRFNKGSDQMRFRYYKSGSYSNQQPIALYRLAGGTSGDDNGEGGTDTPEPAPGLEASCGWLELPGMDDLATASEYTFRAGDERNYTAFYDSDTYSSLWIAYPLAKGHSGSLSRPGSWYFAPGIDQSLQVDLTSHSYDDNYSRGHQIPNGDRNGNSTMQNQTFYVINSVPQIQDGFNGGIWNALEDQIRGAVPSNDSLYVATGPVYRTVGGSETISYTSAKDDTKDLPVANYFFKVVLKVKRSGNQITDAKTVGFWFEHKVYSGNDYEACAVTVDSIEQLTGYDFFANLPDDIEAIAENNASWSAFKAF